MGLGSFLGSAGLADPYAERGYAAGVAHVNARRAQEFSNRARDEADAEALRQQRLTQAMLDTGIPTLDRSTPGERPILEAPPTPAPAPAATPAPAPAPAAAAPAVAGVTPPAAVAGPAVVPAAPQTVGVAPPSYETAGNAAANAPPPPSNVLTPEEVDVAGRWLRGNQGTRYFTAHPEEARAFAADQVGWIRRVLMPRKAPGLLNSPDPIQAVRTQANTTRSEQGFWGQLGDAFGIAGFADPSGANPVPNAVNPYAGPDTAALQQKVGRLDQFLSRIASNLTRQSREALANAQVLAAPDLTINPQSATDVVPTSTAPMGAGAAEAVARGESPGPHYQAHPEELTRDTKRALLMRQYIAQRAQGLARVGGAEAAATIGQLIPKIAEIDSSILFMQGQQGLLEAATLGDPRRLAAVMSDIAQVPLNIQMVRDGTYNIVNEATGKNVAEGITLEQLLDRGQTMFDTKYREDKRAAEVAVAAENRAQQGKERIEYIRGSVGYEKQALIEAGAMARTIEAARLKGEFDIALQQYKSQHPEDHVTSLGDGVAVIQRQDGSVIRLNPSGSTVEGTNGEPIPVDAVETILPARGGQGTGGVSGTFLAGEL